jgi:hypothetical protein
MAQMNPTPGDLHVSTPLTNFAQKYVQDQNVFVATKAFPNRPVAKQYDKYWIFDKADWLRNNAKKRAPGTESQGTGFTLSTDTFQCENWSLHYDITDEARANADDIIMLEESGTQFLTQQMLIAREVEFSSIVLNSSSWTGGTLNVDWSISSSTPIANIRAAKQAVQKKTGKIPNKMILGRTAYDTLIDNDEILARITGGATTNMPAMVMRTLLAQILELEQIFVMDSVYNTALDGATDSMSFIGGDTALVYYAPNIASPVEPSALTGFSWTGVLGATNDGLRIRKFRQESIKSDRIEIDAYFDYKVTGADLGYTFTTVSAA